MTGSPHLRRGGLLTVIAMVALLLSGCGGGEEVDASVLILQDANVRWKGSTCTGAGRLTPIRDGAPVTIFLADDTLTSELNAGVRTPEGNCRFTFDLSNVTAGYAQFRVGSLPRVQGIISDNGRDALWVTIGYD